jgi:hypothetical protein
MEVRAIGEIIIPIWKPFEYQFTVLMADTPAIPKLLEFAASRFSAISPAEQKLFYATADGKVADCTCLLDEDRTIQSDCLLWLCTNPDASAQVTYRGVSVFGAEIDGELDLEWAKISFPLWAQRCVFKGSIVLQNSHLVSLNLATSSIKNLRAENLITEHDVTLSAGFQAQGTVNLAGATIGGNLDCDEGHFTGENKNAALIAYGAKIEGSVFLCGGKAEGQVNLVTSSVGGNLVCDGRQFISNCKGPALHAGGAQILGNVLLQNGFRAEGGVNFAAATIRGHLLCDGGQFVSKGEKPALHAASAKIDGNVFLRDGFRAEGEVRFTAAYIGGSFQWSGVESPKTAILNLRSAKVGSLLNEKSSWPRKLYVGGLVYDQIEDCASPNADVQLGWLHLQPQKPFLSQPYKQLAEVLKSSGYESEATEVLIAKQDDLRRYGDLKSAAKLWNFLLGFSIGHGYKPHRAFLLMAYFLWLGAALFHDGYKNHLITPINQAKGERDTNYPKFQSFVYSLDCFLPIIDLKQKGAWSPNVTRGYEIVIPSIGLRERWGGLLRAYLYFHTLLGWALTTLWVAGFTGFIGN